MAPGQQSTTGDRSTAGRALPPPTDTGDVYLAAILDRLDTIVRLLTPPTEPPKPTRRKPTSRKGSD